MFEHSNILVSSQHSWGSETELIVWVAGWLFVNTVFQDIQKDINF